MTAHITTEQLERGLADIQQSPRSSGRLTMIVRRPGIGEREILAEGTLDLVEGLAGDGWRARGSKRTEDGSAEPERQLTVMNSRVIALIEPVKERWPLAGDQLFVDLDLSVDHLPMGARLAIGSAVIEVTAPPHNGCKKFTERFGVEATAFISTPLGKQLRLRGLNAKVVEPGVIRTGDIVTVVGPSAPPANGS